MRPTHHRTLAIVATLALTAAACGDDSSPTATDGPESSTPVTTVAPTSTDTPMTVPDSTDEPMDEMDEMDEPSMATVSTDDGASTLRAGLTSLLQEHVYLAGIAIETAVDAGGDLEQPEVQAAVAALDENSVALSEAIGSVAGQDHADAFLGLWRQHIGFFVDYTLGAATGDTAMQDQALTDLAGYQQAAGAFFEEITGGEIVAADLVDGLEMHVTTLTDAIDAVVAGEPAAFERLRTAAQHMFGAALFLSTGIANAAPEMFPGDVTSPPAETRAVLTNLLQEHVYLAGIAIEQAIEAGGDLEQPAVQAAVSTLDANSMALADVVGSVAGQDDADAFLGLWRQHIGFFVDYTLGAATGDTAMQDQALTDLAGYQQAAGAFFEEITGGALPADALIANLDMHVATLTAAIDSLVAGDGNAFDLLRDAAQHMPSSALALSTAIVEATS